MDEISQLECVHYAGPIPMDAASMLVLTLLYDRVHFPGTYLPKGDYDKDLLLQEIGRLEQLKSDRNETQQLIGLLKFLKYRLWLDGIFEYPHTADELWGQKSDSEQRLVRAIYDAMFPPRKNFEPMFSSSTLKNLPGSKEDVVVSGDFHFQARAIQYAQEKNLPLLECAGGIPLPFRGRHKDNARSLSNLLAMESLALTLPDLPSMTMQELVDFRLENKKELQNFRSTMLRYANTLNAMISESADDEEVMRKANFLADTEILPALHDLQRDLDNPNRPWQRRLSATGRIVATLGIGHLIGTSPNVAESVTKAVLDEIDAASEKGAIKRSGLYYLLQVKTLAR